MNIDHLKKILAADPALAAEVEALLRQTPEGGRMIATASGGGVVVQQGGAGATDGSLAIAGSVFGDIRLESREKPEARPDESLDAKYLGFLFHEVGRVELAKIDKSIDRADPLAGFELQAVYTALLTKTQRTQTERFERTPEAFNPRQERALSALESPSRRVLRGGAFGFGPRYVRCAVSDWIGPDLRYYSVGFRVVVSPARSGL